MSSDEANVGAGVDRMVGAEPVPGSAKSDPILVADGVRRSFGGLTAVDVEHVEVQRGTITALIGPNGAGKSTLFNLLTGFDRVDRGRWTFEGRAINGKRGHQVARAGMVRTFQLTKALTRMTVLDNMLLGAPGQFGERMAGAFLRPVWQRQERENTARALVLLERFKLIDKRDDMAGSLSGGQRKLLEMARSLMTDPSMIMLDEPMAGVNPALVQSLLGHITALRDEGKTVLFVEHDMDVIMGISDWIVVLAQGRVIAEGRPSDIRADQQVIDAYLGAQEETVETQGSGE
ncbi:MULTISPECIES: ABC transporter ATP-binding protein [Nocardiopsidaceae]|jgi:branched-chain amino acid transport system ATP-binding protein|uniref:ABC transporter ATP-binding protein n=2 Tax=Nocardiopsidaceae TaxID=83676 RepID=A0ABY6YIG7_9ACTN|nr:MULTISPECIES: ABC transporter ATP-binding protein [Nocardiopsaceae]MEE2043164.1 ABC transporter ATP-binding protein [Nocardiopsis tropica]MEE2055267.1 ABC transporter ATP-binding protein [Nocardiopsis umidischolae]WAE71946.1 ABC transporter ATP-binding protein [Streptomonospora nanhaiensis]